MTMVFNPNKRQLIIDFPTSKFLMSIFDIIYSDRSLTKSFDAYFHM